MNSEYICFKIFISLSLLLVVDHQQVHFAMTVPEKIILELVKQSRNRTTQIVSNIAGLAHGERYNDTMDGLLYKYTFLLLVIFVLQHLW